MVLLYSVYFYFYFYFILKFLLAWSLQRDKYASAPGWATVLLYLLQLDISRGFFKWSTPQHGHQRHSLHAKLASDQLTKYKGLLTAKRSDLPVRFVKGADGVHGVLMGGLELGVHLGLALKIHLPEHVERRLFAGTTSTGVLVLQRSDKLPSIFIATEAEGLAVLKAGR